MDRALPTAVMRLSSMTTTALLIAGAPVPSISREAFKTTRPFPIGGSGVIRAGVWDTAGVNTESISVSSRSSLKFFNGVLWFWSSR